MPQLTIYLDERTQLKARRAAKRAGRSVSAWAREQLSAAADAGEQWPEGYAGLFGSITDPSFVVPERPSWQPDLQRESL